MSSFLEQQKQRAENEATGGPSVNPVAQITKTSDPGTGGGATDSKTEASPKKTGGLTYMHLIWLELLEQLHLGRSLWGKGAHQPSADGRAAAIRSRRAYRKAIPGPGKRVKGREPGMAARAPANPPENRVARATPPDLLVRDIPSGHAAQ